MKYKNKFKQYPTGGERLYTHYEGDRFSTSESATPAPKIYDMETLKEEKKNEDVSIGGNDSSDLNVDVIPTKDLIQELEKRISIKMVEFEELGVAVKLKLVLRESPEEIAELMIKMALIIQELSPVLYILKFHYPQYDRFFDALLVHINKDSNPKEGKHV